MPKLSNYTGFLSHKVNEGIIRETDDSDINKHIDDTYTYFKEIKKEINTKDIIDRVEYLIGKELDDDDYVELYYKITGEYIDSDEIDDLDEEEKFIIK